MQKPSWSSWAAYYQLSRGAICWVWQLSPSGSYPLRLRPLGLEARESCGRHGYLRGCLRSARAQPLAWWLSGCASTGPRASEPGLSSIEVARGGPRADASPLPPLPLAVASQSCGVPCPRLPRRCRGPHGSRQSLRGCYGPWRPGSLWMVTLSSGAFGGPLTLIPWSSLAPWMKLRAMLNGLQRGTHRVGHISITNYLDAF